MLAAHQTVQAQQKAVLPLETCSRQTDKRNLVQTRRWNAERVSDLPEVTGGHSTTDPISQTLLKIILIASILIVHSFWVLLPTPSLVMQDRDRAILDSSEDHLHWAWEEQPGLLLGAQDRSQWDSQWGNSLCHLSVTFVTSSTSRAEVAEDDEPQKGSRRQQCHHQLPPCCLVLTVSSHSETWIKTPSFSLLLAKPHGSYTGSDTRASAELWSTSAKFKISYQLWTSNIWMTLFSKMMLSFHFAGMQQSIGLKLQKTLLLHFWM